MPRACFLWVGRHSLLPAELEFIARILGSDLLVLRRDWVRSDRHLAEIVRGLKRRCGRVVVSGTMPLSVYMRLAPLQEELGFELWWPEMKELAVDVDVTTARHMLSEDTRRRTIVCSAATMEGCRVYEFVAFRRLRAVELKLEPIQEEPAKKEPPAGGESKEELGWP